ncbi:tetratricopeptide repeat protein [Thermoflexus hugenholtzii]
MPQESFSLEEFKGLAFGELLQRLLRLTKLRTSILVDSLGIDRAQVSRWIRGQTRPNRSHMEKLIWLLRDRRPSEIPSKQWEEALNLLWQKSGHEPSINKILKNIKDQNIARIGEIILNNMIDLIELMDKAVDFFQEREWERGLRKLFDIEKAMRVIVNPALLEIHIQKMFGFYRTLQYDRALEEAKEGLRLADELSDPLSKGRLLILRGDLHRRIGDFEQARTDFQTALEAYGNLPGPEAVRGRTRCYRKRAVTFLFQGWPKRAEEELQRAILAHQQHPDPEEGDKIAQVRAWISLQKGNWEEAIELHQRVVGRLRTAHAQNPSMDPWGLAKALRYLGDAYRIARRYQEARQCYQEALRICEQLRRAGRDTRIVESMIELGLGRIALREGVQPEAQERLTRARRFIEGIRIDSRRPEVLMELAELAWHMREPINVQEMLEEAQRQFQDFRHWAYYAQCRVIEARWYVEDVESNPSPDEWRDLLEILREVYELAEDPVKVRELYPDAPPGTRLVDEIPLLHYHVATGYLLQGRLALRLNMTEEASSAFQASLTHAEKFNAPFLEETARHINDLLRTVPGEVASSIRAQLLDWSKRADNPRLRQALRELGSS